MPIYEFVCPQCETEFEVMRPVSQADQPAHCPRCQTQGIRQISAFASKVGFYIKAPAKEPLRKPASDVKG
ncbi:MAG: zinc ribbon domain-containing protein [Chloroflexi bacterium]|nr:zinc ribbon domain-containing protein [Chloroflexota bacterium]